MISIRTAKRNKINIEIVNNVETITNGLICPSLFKLSLIPRFLLFGEISGYMGARRTVINDGFAGNGAGGIQWYSL